MKQIKEYLQNAKCSKFLSKVYLPEFLDLTRSGDIEKFKNLALSGVTICDTIVSQTEDFIKKKHPSHKFSQEELTVKSQELLGDNPESYGTWVYYPWSHRLVHLLPEEHFIEVRTSRNQYKITQTEQQFLKTKKVGVIGLSVGQSVSVTMAMERTCGELRLADFDTLELTNLNRIRTGIHNLGLPKVVSVAREIAEVDPFIKVKIFPNGLNESNLDEFFLTDGKLDLMIEESDGFDIKILSRYKARQLKVPVLMEASDRCMVDVERFDLEPNRPILHGLVDHLKIEDLKMLKTTEEKIPYMMDVLGLDTASARLKASMIEIDQTINTWPQLASAVTMGGGITTDVARRLLLGQFSKSGRYYVDVEELIGDSTKNAINTVSNHSEVLFDFTKAKQSLSANITNKDALQIEKSLLVDMVASACLAPSGGNSQPWRWIVSQNTLYLFNPFKPGSTLLDYDGAASKIAIGASLENLKIHAGKMGLDYEIKFNATFDVNRPFAEIKFVNGANLKQSDLDRFPAIFYRNTNRAIAPRTPISRAIFSEIKKAAEEIEDATVEFITDSKELEIAGDILSELEKIRFLDPIGHRDFVNEMRWTDEENIKTRDGVDIKTVDLTNSELAGFKIARDKEVINYVNQWNGGNAFKKLTKKGIDGAGAIGVLYFKRSGKVDYVQAGRALEKIWLETNLRKVALHPVSACLFLYARLLDGKGVGLDSKTITAMRALRPNFEKVFCQRKDYREMFIFRLTNCGDAEVKSLRKPISEVLHILE
jgi:molybdopterin/thiamine biosynthesis adenylyltransferase